MERPTLGEWIAAAAGVLLLVGMSLDWFALTVTAERIPGASGLADQAGGLNAWQTFEWIDLVLLAGAVVAVAGVAGRLTGGLAELPVDPGLAIAAAGFVALGAAVLGIVDPPIEEGTFAGGIVVEAARQPGAWLSLLACGGIVAGGLLSAWAESLPAPLPERP